MVKTRKEPIVDHYFGEAIVDPYRWLEDDDSEEVKRWTADQNAHTRAVLDGQLRTRLRVRIDALLEIGFVSSPAVRTMRAGKKTVRRYFYVRREGKQDQPIVYVREGRDGKDVVLLAPTTFSDDGTSALDWWYPSWDGALVAWGASVSGNEQSTLRIRDVATGSDLADVIPRTRIGAVAWHPDGKSFFYTREPDPGSVPKGEEHYHRRVYHHVIGTDWQNDPLIFPPPGTDRPMTEVPATQVSPAGRWLVVRVFQGWAKSSVFVKDLHDPKAKMVAIVEGIDALFDPIFHRDAKGNDIVFLRTNDGAPNFRIFALDPKRPERSAWREVVAEQKDPIRDFDAVGGALFVGYLTRAHSRIEIRGLDGSLRGEVPLQAMSTAAVPHGEVDGDEALFETQSFTVAPRVYAFGIPPVRKKVAASGERSIAVEEFASIAWASDHPFSVDQIEARSKDGTLVTAFVIHRSDVPRDGSAPAILCGYGGFNISQTPTFNRGHVFLERGGVYVVANLRGGAENGERWHRAGMLESKQNVFDDAVAVAEKLIADRWTSSRRLAVVGGSNGGLLVGALVTQRPDLFRAAVCTVPLLDMLRYHHFLIARLWVAEYGSSEDATQYRWLRAYSPYHHVTDGVAYPAMLLMTAESDARVDPMHARKMAARLQEATSAPTNERPILLRVEARAGHGAGKPRSKQLEELTDQYTFLFQQLGVSLHPP